MVQPASIWLNDFLTAPGLCGTFINNYAGGTGAGSLLETHKKTDNKTPTKSWIFSNYCCEVSYWTEFRTELLVHAAGERDGISIPGGSWVTSRGRGECLEPRWAWMAGGEWIGSFTLRVAAARLHVPSALDNSASWSFCFSAARMTALCHSSPEYAFLPGMDAVHMASSIVSAWQTIGRQGKTKRWLSSNTDFLISKQQSFQWEHLTWLHHST